MTKTTVSEELAGDAIDNFDEYLADDAVLTRFSPGLSVGCLFGGCLARRGEGGSHGPTWSGTCASRDFHHGAQRPARRCARRETDRTVPRSLHRQLLG